MTRPVFSNAQRQLLRPDCISPLVKGSAPATLERLLAPIYGGVSISLHLDFQPKSSQFSTLRPTFPGWVGASTPPRAAGAKGARGRGRRSGAPRATPSPTRSRPLCCGCGRSSGSPSSPRPAKSLRSPDTVTVRTLPTHGQELDSRVGAGHPTSGSQSASGSERGSSMRRARVAPTPRSSIWPNALRRMRPALSMTTRLGVPRSWNRPIVMGSVPPGSCASTPTGNVIRYSYRNASSDTGGHGVVVFEHAVEPEHGNVVAEDMLDALGLRQPVRDAAGAEHLERLDHHDLAPETGQSWVIGSIEPTGDRQLGSSGVPRLHGQRRLHSLRASQHGGRRQRGGVMTAGTPPGDKCTGNLRV